MRINIVSGPFYPFPPAPTGAVQRIWYDLARRFVDRGHEVHVQSCGYPGFDAQQDVDGIHVRRLTTLKHTRSTPMNLAMDLRYSLRVLTMLPPADITVLNCFWLPAVLSRLPGSGRWGKTYVSIARAPKKQIKLYLKCDRLQAVSQAVARMIVQEQPAAEAITRAIPNPIDTLAFNAPSIPQPPGPPKVLYTGRIHPEKGLELLVRACRQLQSRVPDLTLELVGESAIEKGGGGPAFVQSLQALAGPLPLAFGQSIYDRPALADRLRTAHVYCYPSIAEKGESFGVAPLEAMAVGVPVVVSALEVFGDFLRPNENGLVFDHRSPEAVTHLADALHRVLSDRTLANSLAQAGAQTATAFSNDAIADRFLEDFESLLHPDHQPEAGQ